MLVRYADLTALRLAASDDTTHPVEDVLIDEASLGAAYVVADVGGWFRDRHAMVPLRRLGTPDIAASRWPVTLDRAALEEKPEPAPVEAGAGPAEAAAPAREGGLRAALIAPVGGVLAQSQGDREAGIRLHADPNADAGGADGGARGLRSVGEWVDDTDVAAEDGAAGKLIGLIFETEGWAARYIVIETGGDGLPENQRVVPCETIAGIDWDARAMRLACSVAHVHDSPDLHEMDGLEGKWYNTVLAYYGLQS